MKRTLTILIVLAALPTIGLTRQRVSDVWEARYRDAKRREMEAVQRIEHLQERLNRIYWVCNAKGVDLRIVDDEAFWPAEQFGRSIKTGDKAYIAKLDVRQVLPGNMVTAFVGSVECVVRIDTDGIHDNRWIDLDTPTPFVCTGQTQATRVIGSVAVLPVLEAYAMELPRP